MADSYAPILIRPELRHIDEYGGVNGWHDEQVERARELLRNVRVVGTDPLQPTLGAIAEYLRGFGFDFGENQPLVQLATLLNQVVWLGPLAEFLEVPGLANVQINGAGRDVILEYASGARDVLPHTGIRQEWIEYLVARWLGHRGARVSPEEGVPAIVHGTINRMRFTYLGREHATSGMTLQVRLPMPRPSLDDLVDRGLLTADVARWLRAFVAIRANILVAGGTNAGKTTLVNALLAEIDPMERLAVVEMFAELDVADRPGTVAYEVGWDANEEDLTRLLHANLYNSVRRLVLGEARGGEAAQLLLAMSSGVEGCIATIHAESGDDAPRRLAQCARMSPAMGSLLTGELNRLIANLDLIVVHLQINPGEHGPRRRVTQVIEVFDSTEHVFKRHEIFRLDESGKLAWAEPGLSDRLWARLKEHKATLPTRQDKTGRRR